MAPSLAVEQVRWQGLVVRVDACPEHQQVDAMPLESCALLKDVGPQREAQVEGGLP